MSLCERADVVISAGDCELGTVVHGCGRLMTRRPVDADQSSVDERGRMIA